MTKGDILLIPFPFSDLTGNKLRPAVVLISTNSDVTVCFITTQFQWKDRYDFEIIPSSCNGLKKASILRLSKLATIDKELVLGSIGKLEEKYINTLNTNLVQILQLK